jgi:hypothetical protein
MESLRRYMINTAKTIQEQPWKGAQRDERPHEVQLPLALLREIAR